MKAKLIESLRCPQLLGKNKNCCCCSYSCSFLLVFLIVVVFVIILFTLQNSFIYPFPNDDRQFPLFQYVSRSWQFYQFHGTSSMPVKKSSWVTGRHTLLTAVQSLILKPSNYDMIFSKLFRKPLYIASDILGPKHANFNTSCRGGPD